MVLAWAVRRLRGWLEAVAAVALVVAIGAVTSHRALSPVVGFTHDFRGQCARPRAVTAYDAQLS